MATTEAERRVIKGLRLGKKPPKRDPRTLRLAKYMTREALPPAPTSKDYTPKVMAAGGFPMYANDRYGCCAEADGGHQEETWIFNAGGSVNFTDQNILSVYSAVTGFNPNDPSTDQGTYWLDLLNYWRKVGYKDATGKVHQIAGFMSVDPRSTVQIRTAVWLFGGLQLGIALPLTASDQYQAGKAWTVVSTSGRGKAGSWGGHAVPVPKYTSTSLYVVTWGGLQRMTYSFMRDYCDEAYVVLSQDWINQVSKLAPSGLDYTQLAYDLNQFPLAA
jgi:hypothetical protein